MGGKVIERRLIFVLGASLAAVFAGHRPFDGLDDRRGMLPSFSNCPAQ
jgi:hypothetical protein